MTTTIHGIQRRSSSTTWPALAVGLALTATGQAHAQVAQAQPAAPPATAPVTPDGAPTGAQTSTTPPSQTLAEANPLAEQQLAQIRQMVSSMPRLIEANGYFRAGIGINSKGGDQDA